MVDFKVDSDLVEVHSTDGKDFFWVHEDLLRQQFGNYHAMIDEAVKTTGTDSIQLNLSHGALEGWAKLLYGEPLGENNNNVYLKPLLELYEYSQTQFHPEVDHRCANACLDGIRQMLAFDFREYYEFDIFGWNNYPTLVEVAARLDKFNGKGVQMLVDMLVHSSEMCWNAEAVDNMIKHIESVPCLTSFFQKLSAAFAIRACNATNEDPECVISTPDPMSPHAYHSRREGATLCCGR